MTGITGAELRMDGWNVKMVSMRHEDRLHSYNRWFGPAELSSSNVALTNRTLILGASTSLLSMGGESPTKNDDRRAFPMRI